jgi:peptidyl-prolyl cis-trans isomerase C
MKRALAVTLAVFFCAAAVRAEDEAVKAVKLTPDTVVARINGADIPYWEYKQATRMIMQDILKNGRHGEVGIEDKAVQTQIFAELTRRFLFVQEGMKDAPPDMDKVVDDGFSALRGKFKTEEDWNSMLAKEEMTPEQIKRMMREDLYIAAYIEKQIVAKVPSPSEQEILAYYADREKRDYNRPEQVELRHIFRPGSAVNPEVDTAAWKKMQEFKERLLKGEDFTEMALRESGDPMTRQYGGLLGFRSREDLPAAVAEACFATEVGKFTDIVKSEFGYHIFLVMQKRPPTNTPLEEVRGTITEKLRRFAVNQAMDKDFKRLSMTVKMEVLLPHFATQENAGGK